MAIMQEWVEAHGGPDTSGRDRVVTTPLEDARGFARLSFKVAAAPALLSVPALLLLGLHLWRRTRVKRLIEENIASSLCGRLASQAGR
jgi:hypothetical protein